MGKPKANIEKLNKDLQKLYELLCEVKSNTPDMELSNEWDDVFSEVFLGSERAIAFDLINNVIPWNGGTGIDCNCQRFYL